MARAIGVDHTEVLKNTCVLAGMAVLLMGLCLAMASGFGMTAFDQFGEQAADYLGLPQLLDSSAWFKQMPGAVAFFRYCFCLGAFVLLPPPLINWWLSAREYKETGNNLDAVRLSEMLSVLQAFLILSSALFFVSLAPVGVLTLRITLSVLIFLYLKTRKMLPGFRLSYLASPKFYLRTLRGKPIGLYAGALGIEFLGLGYALGFNLLMAVGSLYLVVFAYTGWRATGERILLAWVILNVLYVLSGTILSVQQFHSWI